MASAAIGEVVHQFQRLYGEGTVAGLSEGELLDQFARRRDELAFAALVARHGPMVRGVCRGVLRDPNDADDAFQATFLVLARKAGSIRGRDALGGWLHRVARRVAVRASVESSKRRGREQPGGLDSEPIAPSEDPDRFELCRLVHEEVDRLPENYRKAVVLCDLEGYTHEEAAARLAWPVGTVKGRLFRARDRLRDRLVRRGLAVPVASAAGLVRSTSASIVPDALLQSTVKIATSLAVGRASAGLVPASVLLAEGVLRAMFWNKIKLTAAAGLGVAVLSLGIGSLAIGGTRGNGNARAVVDSPEDFHKAIQGDWYPSRIVKDGTTVETPKEPLNISADEIGGKPNERAKYTLQLGRSPAGIELTLPAGPEEGKTIAGVIKLEGNTLTICWGRPGAPRAEEFVSAKGSGHQLIVLTRTPSEPSQPAPPPAAVSGSTPASKKAIDPAEDLAVEAEFRKSEVESRGQAAFQEMLAVALLRRKRDALKAGQPQPNDENMPGAGGMVQFPDLETAEKAVKEAENGLERAQKEHREAIRLSKEADARLAALSDKEPVPRQALRTKLEDVEKVAGVIAEGEAQLELAEIDLNALKGQISAVQQELYRLRAQTQEPSARTDPSVGQRLDETINRAILVDREMREQFLKKSRALGRLRAEIDRLRRQAAVGGPVGSGPTNETSKKGVIRVGDTIVVEVLEALPGRPLQGERRVREDGTISLGFYGDVKVAGLNRKQLKESVVTHLRRFLTDESLGLKIEDMETHKITEIAPADSDRVYVDDAPGTATTTGSASRVDDLERKLDRLIRAIEGKKDGASPF